MKRPWTWAGAGIGVLALVGGAIALRGEAPSPGQAQAPAAAPLQAAPPIGHPPAVLVDLVLLPDGPVHAVSGSVRIGLGFVSDDNAATAPAGPGLEPQQAGPSRYDELATPTRWIAPPAELLADGRVRIGPLRLPHADRYTLQARGEDGLRYYAAAFIPAAVPVSVAPIVGAGVRAHVTVDGTRLLFRRVESSAPAAIWQRLQEWVAPAVLEAFNEQPLAVRNGQVLAPLAPGAVEIVLEVDGVEAERRRLSLSPGQITDVQFDPTSQKVAQAVSVDLELEFVRQGSGKPVSGLQVTWLSGRTQQSAVTDAGGLVRFAGLDRQQAQQFNLASSPSAGELPEWPELRPLQIEPEDLVGSDAPRETIRHRVILAPLRWLIARAPADANRTRADRRSPYPIYVLQRQRAGRWMDAAADHFIEVPEGLAVSVAEPGLYRVAAAHSPWKVLESSSVQVTDAERSSVAFSGARGTSVEMTVLRDGKPLAGAPVHIIGPVGHLPPEVLKANANGRVTLAAATVPSVRVEVPGSDQIEVPLSGKRVLADFGMQRSE
jgi:hypothetical protein